MPKLLAPLRAWELALSEAVVVDLRPPGDFAQGHPQGALSLPFSQRGLRDRLSGVLPGETPIIVLAIAPEEVDAALAQLLEGLYPTLGVLEGGMAAWQEAGLPIAPLPEVSVQELASRTPSRDLVPLDVREPMEWETGHVPGAILVSLGSLRENLHVIPRQARIAVICEAGVRSSTAASILQTEGFADVANVPEGTGGYRRAGLPLQFPGEAPTGEEPSAGSGWRDAQTN